MMAKAGATHEVVMAYAQTIKCVIKARLDYDVKVMGDNLGCPDMVGAAQWLERLGCDYAAYLGK